MSVTVRSSRRIAAMYHDHLTPPGRALLWALLAAGALRMGALSPPLYIALASLAALLAVAVLAGLPFRPKVEAQRRISDNPTAGKPWFYEVRVDNRSSRSARDLVVEEIGLPDGLEAAPPAEPLAVLTAGSSTVFSLGLTAARRGVYELHALQAATLFPTGLVKPSRYLPSPHRLVVHPRFDRRTDLSLPSAGRCEDGDRRTRPNGADFAGLRDWRDGDRPRDVHWGAYARSGRLVVRETADDGRPRVALLLHSASAENDREPGFEGAVSTAAGIAELLLRQGHSLELVLASNSVLRPPSGGPHRLTAVLDLLAVAEVGQSLDRAGVEAEAGGLTVAILVLAHDEPEPEDLLWSLEARGVATRTVRGAAP